MPRPAPVTSATLCLSRSISTLLATTESIRGNDSAAKLLGHELHEFQRIDHEDSSAFVKIRVIRDKVESLQLAHKVYPTLDTYETALFGT